MSTPLFKLGGDIYQTDKTKRLRISPGGTTDTVTTLATNPTANVTISLPDTAGQAANIVLSETNQTLNADYTFSGSNVFSGDVEITGTMIGSISSTDAVLFVNSAPATAGKDTGILGQRYQLDNDTALGDVIADTADETGTLQAGSGTSATLANGASSSDSYYIGWWIKITSGGGADQVRQITAYTGATRVATVSSAWTVDPTTSTYSLYSGSFAGMVYDESADQFQLGHVAEGTSSQITTTKYAGVKMSQVHCVSSTAGVVFQPGGAGTTSSLIAASPAANRVYTLADAGTDASFIMSEGNQTINGTLAATNVSGTNTGDITLAAVGAVPNANGASLSGQELTLQPADESNPGIVTTGAQTFAGAKTFSGAISASNLSGTNSGDITLAAVGAVPNANGASLSGQELTLQPADETNPGIVTTGAQTFAGAKTFTEAITAPNIGDGGDDVTLAAVGSVPNANGASLNGQELTLQPADGSNPGVLTAGTQTIGGAKTFSSDVSVSANINLPDSTGSTVGVITYPSGRMFHNYTSNASKTNVFIGLDAGNFTNSGAYNVMCGQLNGQSLTSGEKNTCWGHNCAPAITTGSNNCILAVDSGNLSTGSNNTFVGAGAGNAISTTSHNICINSIGNSSDSGVIRIGNTNNTAAYIRGISGVTVASGLAVYVSSSGHLGTVTSSIRYKDNVVNTSDVRVAKIHQLRVVDFNYKTLPGESQTGLIAEEVKEIFPEFIAYEEDGVTPMSVQYHLIYPLLIREVQLQRQKISQLEHAVSQLQALP